ncbi:MAG: PEP-CTERM sorting domain-containing protein [Proteobacteria bacterium]|nr:PEP-CTERM sorting domain-containing protein [Pseudomonadota bacterium]
MRYVTRALVTGLSAANAPAGPLRSAGTGLLLGLLAFSVAHAAVLHDESLDGDLSGDRNAPDAFALEAGSNTLTATSVSGDLEYVTLSIGAGDQLDSIQLSDFTNEDISFLALQEGSVFTEPATGPDVAALLGWAHFGLAQLGTDILDDLAAGPGAIGFDRPLGEGDYTFWIQETGPTAATYTLDFLVSPVPEPGTLSLVALGGVGLAAWARRRARAAAGPESA